MELNEFEKRLKQSYNQPSSNLDLDGEWQKLADRLDEEMPKSFMFRRIALWLTGATAIFLALGYCVRYDSGFPGFDQNQFQLENNSSSSFDNPQSGETNNSLQNQIEKTNSKFDQSMLASQQKASSEAEANEASKGQLSNEFIGSEDGAIKDESELAIAEQKSDLLTDPKAQEELNEGRQKETFASGIIDKKEVDTYGRSASDEIEAQINEQKQQWSSERSESMELLYDDIQPIEQNEYVLSQGRFRKAPFAQQFRNRDISISLITGVAKPMGSFKTSSADLVNLANLHNSAYNYLETFSVQALYEYPISRNFKIGSGLDFAQTTRLLSIDNQKEISRTLENVVVEIKVNAITGDTTFIREDVQQTGTSFQSIKHYNSLISWSVPLQIQYHTSLHTFGLGFTMGTLFTFSQTEKGRFLDDQGNVTDEMEIKPGNIQQLYMAPMINYPLSDLFSVELRPYAQISFNNSAQIKGLERRPMLLGGQLGLRYHLSN